MTMFRIPFIAAACAPLLLSLAATPQVGAVTLLQDDFSSDTTASYSTYTTSLASTTGYDYAIVADAVSPGSDGLQLDPGTSGNRLMVRSFSEVTLGVGDSISLSLDFRFVEQPPSQTQGFIVALAELSTASSQRSNIDAGGTATSRIQQNIAGTADNIGGTFAGIDLGLTSHSLLFTMTRTGADSMDYNYTIDGGSTLSVTRDDTGLSVFTFDSIAIGFSGGSSNSPIINFDNILVTSTIPEPGSLGFLVPVALGLGMMRRRRLSRQAQP